MQLTNENDLSSLNRREFLLGASAAGGALLSEPLSSLSEVPAGSPQSPEAAARHPRTVPPPSPVHTDFEVGVIRFDGWEHWQKDSPWKPVRSYPDRRPVLGYYDSSLPEVLDWEIKWMLECGISYAVHCWYRKNDNVGKPVTVNDLFLQNAIHRGFFHAKYRDLFRFAIMWENQNAGGVASESDLLDNLLPFWIANYFKHPSYYKLNGVPVLYVYEPRGAIKQLGGVEKTKSALDRVRQSVRQSGFPGLLIFCEYRGLDPSVLAAIAGAGFDAQFAYCVDMNEAATAATGKDLVALADLYPSPQQVLEWQLNYFESRKRQAAFPMITTASVGWDPKPWEQPQGADYLTPHGMNRWRLSPEQYGSLLRSLKQLNASLPAKHPYRKTILLDNWNEFGEGHFISPHQGAGFGHLKAVREVFSSRDNHPDYRSPFELGFGPYDLDPA